MTKPRHNDEALGEFVKTVAEIRKALTTLSEITDDHFDVMPEEVHWGHVGDVKRTLVALNEILAIIRGENE